MKQKLMDRLTESAPFKSPDFKTCQLCGRTSTDICEFEMHQECDDSDNPEPNKILIVCRQEVSKSCNDKIVDHPRLYKFVQWATGGQPPTPGMFVLACGDC